MKSETKTNTLSAFEVISKYVAAMAVGDTDTMKSFHADEFMVDWVYGDAFENPPSSSEESNKFFPVWFSGFDEMDYEVKRTIAAEDVVITEWVFIGTNTNPIEPPVFEKTVGPTGKTIEFRGVTIYDVDDGLIQKETIYMDLATLIVELGISV